MTIPFNKLPKTGVEKQRQKSADDSVTKTKEAIAISFFLFWQQTHSVPYHTDWVARYSVRQSSVL